MTTEKSTHKQIVEGFIKHMIDENGWKWGGYYDLLSDYVEKNDDFITSLMNEERDVTPAFSKALADSPRGATLDRLMFDVKFHWADSMLDERYDDELLDEFRNQYRERLFTKCALILQTQACETTADGNIEYHFYESKVIAPKELFTIKKGDIDLEKFEQLSNSKFLEICKQLTEETLENLWNIDEAIDLLSYVNKLDI